MMKLFIPAERHGQAMEILESIQQRLQLSPEHCSSWIQAREQPYPHIVYAEQWKSKDAIYEHIRSPLYRRILAIIELSTKAPEVSFYFISHAMGMELIHALRLEPQESKQELETPIHKICSE
jgi:quinol monooxygenase YgiN